MTAQLNVNDTAAPTSNLTTMDKFLMVRNINRRILDSYQLWQKVKKKKNSQSSKLLQVPHGIHELPADLQPLRSSECYASFNTVRDNFLWKGLPEEELFQQNRTGKESGRAANTS